MAVEALRGVARPAARLAAPPCVPPLPTPNASPARPCASSTPGEPPLGCCSMPSDRYELQRSSRVLAVAGRALRPHIVARRPQPRPRTPAGFDAFVRFVSSAETVGPA